MSEDGLLTRLASYSQNPNRRSVENFATEVLGYLVNYDAAVRRTLINLIVPDGRIRRGFTRVCATSQEHFRSAIVDLVLRNDRGHMILLEVKIDAPETQLREWGRGWQPQIRRYLRLRRGLVAYLTTRNVSEPELGGGSRFLGHYYWEDFHANLKRRRLTSIGKMFVNFLEEMKMTLPAPITRREVRISEDAFNLAGKCEATLDIVRNAVLADFRRLFKTRSRWTSSHFSPFYGSCYTYARGFHRGPVTWLGLYIEPWERKLYFGLFAGTGRDGRSSRLDRYLQWEKDGNQLYTAVSLRGGDSDRARLIRHAKTQLKSLKRVLVRIGA